MLSSCSVSATVRRVVLSANRVAGLLGEPLRLRQPEENTVNQSVRPSFTQLPTGPYPAPSTRFLRLQ